MLELGKSVKGDTRAVLPTKPARHLANWGQRGHAAGLAEEQRERCFKVRPCRQCKP